MDLPTHETKRLISKYDQLKLDIRRERKNENRSPLDGWDMATYPQIRKKELINWQTCQRLDLYFVEKHTMNYLNSNKSKGENTSNLIRVRSTAALKPKTQRFRIEKQKTNKSYKTPTM